MAKRARWSARVLPQARREMCLSSHAEAARVSALVDRALRLPFAHAAEMAQDFSKTARMNQLIGEKFAQAKLFWVAPEMSQLAMQAAQKTPLVSFGDAPSEAGIFAFAEPLPAFDTRLVGGLSLREGGVTDIEFTGSVEVDALGWFPVENKRFMIHLFCRPERLPHKLLENQSRYWVPFAGIETDMFTDLEKSPGQEVARAITSTVAAAWHLMSLPTISSTRKIDTRTGGASTPRTPASAEVSVIDMRPLRNVNAETEAGTGRKLDHRVMVEGYWRVQPVGPGRSQRRAVYVPPHTRGPDGAPLKHRDRVYTWRR